MFCEIYNLRSSQIETCLRCFFRNFLFPHFLQLCYFFPFSFLLIFVGVSFFRVAGYVRTMNSFRHSDDFNQSDRYLVVVVEKCKI